MNNKSSGEKSQLAKEAVIAAARALFAHFGHTKTSVEEIAREAGFSKATVYNYFGGKEAIVAGVIEYERKAMMEALRRAVEEAPDPIAALKTFFLTRNREVQRHFKTYRAGREELIQHMPQVAQAIERSRLEERAIIEAILKEGISRGIFRDLDDVTLAADLLFTAVIGLTFPLFGKPVGRTLEKRAEELVTLFMVGICAAGPRSGILKEEQS